MAISAEILNSYKKIDEAKADALLTAEIEKNNKKIVVLDDPEASRQSRPRRLTTRSPRWSTRSPVRPEESISSSAEATPHSAATIRWRQSF